jgi:hypothetical protein
VPSGKVYQKRGSRSDGDLEERQIKVGELDWRGGRGALSQLENAIALVMVYY